MSIIARIVVALAACLALAIPAFAKPPLEAFGDSSDVRSMQISPDGTRLAYILRRNSVEQLMLMDIATKKQEAIATVTDFQTNGLSFVSNDYVILYASQMLKEVFAMKKFRHSGAFAVNLKTHKGVQLLQHTTNMSIYQTGFGGVDAVDPSGRFVYSGVYQDTNSGLALGVMRVDLETGKGTPVRSGTSLTADWVLNERGDVVAREEFSEKSRQYSIRVYNGDNNREIYSSSDENKRLNVIGLGQDGASLIVSNRGDSNFYRLYEMSTADGSMKGPILSRDDADIESVIMGDDNIVRGVSYAGLFPSYKLLDQAVEKDIKSIQGQLPDAAVDLTSWSKDWSKVLLVVSGGTLTTRFVLFDRVARKLDLIAYARPSIKPEEVGQAITIEYKAADGLKISAIVTWPAGVKDTDRKNLPMIVMPHGGPEAYDSVGFDWLPQFFANEGYMVLQPNFRGSGGFGESFAAAGYREWGRKMQSDITDGANALIKMGWADPNRMCILGWSYGGYAALAGGGLTPDLYKCVVSIAGVSDLIGMLGDEQRTAPWYSMRMEYWKKLIGDPARDRAAIEAVSPVMLAANYKVPVLLIHGTDDLTVPSTQSDRMETALKAAGKIVTYLKIPGDDHDMRQPGNRKAMLEAARDFIAKYIGKPN